MAAAEAAQQYPNPLLDNSETDRASPWLRAGLMAVAAAALGWAIQVRDGLYEPKGFVGLTIALLAGGLFFLPPRSPALNGLMERFARWLFAAAVAFNLVQLFAYDHPGSWHAFDDGQLQANRFYYACLSAQAVIVAGMIVRPDLGRPLLIALVAVFCAIGAWVIRSVPAPYMDVWMLQTEGIKAFLHGHSPFAAAFPDIYHRPELYAAGALRADGLVHQGFPYPPMVFWMELPGYWLGGDYRWSNLAAMALAALLIAFTPRRRPTAGASLAPLAAALLLTTPRSFFVLESGWTEPTTLLLLAATVFSAVRLPRVMPVFLGLMLCSKQYLIWAIPPVVLLAGRPLNAPRLVRIVLAAFIAGCVASLPLILWDYRAFVAANFAIADAATFRTDAMSYLALFASVTHHVPTARAATLIGFTAAAFASVLVMIRGPRTAAGYAAGVAFAHVAFFAFYKFAFCNYYYLLIGAFCCAAGAMELPERHGSRGR
jgi:hypothetical protein